MSRSVIAVKNSIQPPPRPRRNNRNLENGVPSLTAPNTRVYDLSTREPMTIHDLQNNGRPLVLIFGPSMCPVYQRMLREFDQTVQSYKDIADFVIVLHYTNPNMSYLVDGMEADDILETRFRTASYRYNQEELGVRVVLDDIDNNTGIAYETNSVRLVIIQNNDFKYIGMGTEGLVNVPEVEDWLQRYRLQIQS